MSYISRKILTPASRKRKVTEASQLPTSSKPFLSPTAVNRAVSFPSQSTTSYKGSKPQPQPQPQPFASNRLLAGFMAHEFLSKGTMFGQRFDPARAEVKRSRLSQPSKEAEPSGKPENYAEVANLLKSEGVHIPGVVNPTQLGTWIKM